MPVWVATLSLNLLGLAMPLAVLQIFGRVIPSEATDTLTMLVFGLLLVAVLEFVLREARARVLQFQARDESNSLSQRLYDAQLFSDPLLDTKSSARKRLRQMQAGGAVAEALNGTGRLHVIELPFACMALILIWSIAGPLVLVPLTGFCALTLAAFMMRFLQSDALEKRTKADEDRYDFWAHVLSNVTLGKTAQMEAGLRAKYAEYQRHSSAASLAAIRSSSLFENLSTVSNHSFASATVLVGAYFVIQGAFGPAELAACTMLSARAVQPALQVIRYWAAGESARNVMKDVREGLGTPTISHGRNLPEQLDGHIVFEDVTTRTSRSGRATLRSESFEIPACTSTRLVSNSRTAPDAVMKLLLGEIVPDKGRVRLDGHNPRDLMSWRGMGGFVYVGQTPVILNATIIENIAGVIEAENIRRAYAVADSIGISDFVNTLPFGFDTHMRESGMHESSTGFLQMIGIARAVAQSPAILMLSDSFSALDEAMRHRVCHALTQDYSGMRLLTFDSTGTLDHYLPKSVTLRAQSETRQQTARGGQVDFRKAS